MKWKILLVHNKFRKEQPITYLSWLIRVVTGGKYNHIAIQVGNRVIESIGKGVVNDSYIDWYKRSDRNVLEMIPRIALTQRKCNLLLSIVGQPYGKWDLVKVGFYYVVQKRLKIKLKAPYNGKGFICSELAALLLGIDWFIVPHEFETVEGLLRGREFETFKAN